MQYGGVWTTLHGERTGSPTGLVLRPSQTIIKVRWWEGSGPKHRIQGLVFTTSEYIDYTLLLGLTTDAVMKEVEVW